jgi:hypothetical protein
MSLIATILYPVDFSSSCVAMAAYVKRAAGEAQFVPVGRVSGGGVPQNPGFGGRGERDCSSCERGTIRSHHYAYAFGQVPADAARLNDS